MSDLSLARGRPVLPRGPHGLPAREIVVSQRGRILQGCVEVVAERGWAGTTVGDIAARAAVSRRTFYELFRDREACFRTAYVRAARLHEKLVDAAGDDEPARLDAYLGTLAAQPAFAKALMVEVLAAGPLVRAERRAVLERYAQRLRERHPSSLPHAVHLGLVGAMDELVRAEVEAGRTASLRALRDPVLQILSPVLELPRWT